MPDGIKQSDSYRLVVRAQDDGESFDEIISGAPDLGNIYLQTDKTVYKPAEFGMSILNSYSECGRN